MKPNPMFSLPGIIIAYNTKHQTSFKSGNRLVFKIVQFLKFELTHLEYELDFLQRF